MKVNRWFQTLLMCRCAGDVMLVQGDLKTSISQIKPNFIVLDSTEQKRGIRRNKAPIAVGILLFTVLAVMFVPRDFVSLTMLVGAIGIVLSGVLTMEEAYDAIDWKSIFLIAGMLPLGSAMQSTGTAALIANGVISAAGFWGPYMVLGHRTDGRIDECDLYRGRYRLDHPHLHYGRRSLGVMPEPFVMTTVIAASSAFLLPIGHQANIIIYGLGGYKFTDFFKVGIWLTLLLLI